ncbi:MAG: DUF6266 family protein, partial [Balneolaceae bacterium]
ILGAFLGKIGPVVASRRGSTIYIKSRPATVKHPNTPKQKAAKSRFGVTSTLSSLLLDFHRHSLLTEPGRTSYNRFISLNIKEAMKETENGFEADYRKLILSAGVLEPLQELKAERTEQGHLSFSWKYEYTDRAKRDDQVLLLAISPALNKIDYRFNAAARMDEEAVLKIPDEFRNEVIYVYSCVQSMDRKRSSDSQFAGEFIQNPMK